MKPRALAVNRGIGTVILVVLLGACANSALSAKDSGIQGTAIYGPTCPVQRVGGPSCQRPYSAVITFRDGQTAATIRSGTDGKFRIELPPGTYTVGAQGNGPPTVKPFEVIVKPHAFTTITVMFDSGIR